MGDDKDAFGFGKFVPGFDFLQQLARQGGAAGAPLPNLSSWVAPTLSTEELGKRIEELKAVMFWLDQNGKALQATIQALEVQKMTLATLEGMNVSMGEMAEAFRLKPEMFAAGAPAAQAPAAEPPAAEPTGRKATVNTGTKAAGAGRKAAPAAGVVDPLQWWGSLTQQFQQIAAQAMDDVARHTAAAAAPAKAAPARAASAKAAPTGKKAAAPRAPARPARKAAARKGTRA